MRNRMAVVGIAASVLAGSPLAARPATPHVTGACLSRERANSDESSRIIQLRVYNQTQMRECAVHRLIEIAGAIWRPYRVTVTSGDGAKAVSVVITDRHQLAEGSNAYFTVLGTTLFTAGHATPYIRLSVSAAEAYAISVDDAGVPFVALPAVRRDSILQQVMGAALAHEIAHYLLDTPDHSPEGLLKAGLLPSAIMHPDPAHLWLTADQQRRLCRPRVAELP
jgi:hypothetical protein